MNTQGTENECRECEGEGGYDTCKGGQASWVECDHCDGTGKVDDYGNPFSGDRIIYCCFPDCGCDGARLCQAENGASGIAGVMNIERGSLPTLRSDWPAARAAAAHATHADARLCQRDLLLRLITEAPIVPSPIAP